MNSNVFFIVAILTAVLHQGATIRLMSDDGRSMFSTTHEEMSSSSNETAQHFPRILEGLLDKVYKTIQLIYRTKVGIIQAVVNKTLAPENVDITEKFQVNITQLKEDVLDVAQQLQASTKVTPELIEAAKQKIGELLNRTIILEQAMEKLLDPMKKPVDMTTTETSITVNTTIDNETAKFKIIVCPIQPYSSLDSSKQYCIKHIENGIVAEIYYRYIDPRDITVVKCGEKPNQWCFNHPKMGILAQIAQIESPWQNHDI